MDRVYSTTYKCRPHYEGSWGATPASEGEVDVTITLTIRESGHAYAEMEIPAIDEYVDIGLRFDEEGVLLDYDGVMTIPTHLLDLIKEAGFTVPPDFY